MAEFEMDMANLSCLSCLLVILYLNKILVNFSLTLIFDKFVTLSPLFELSFDDLCLNKILLEPILP